MRPTADLSWQIASGVVQVEADSTVAEEGQRMDPDSDYL